MNTNASTEQTTLEDRLVEAWERYVKATGETEQKQAADEIASLHQAILNRSLKEQFR